MQGDYIRQRKALPLQPEGFRVKLEGFRAKPEGLKMLVRLTPFLLITASHGY